MLLLYYFYFERKYDILNRGGCSVSKRLVKLTSFKSFPLQLSGYQDISLLSFVRVASSTLIRCGWVFINVRSVENCISVERFNTLSTEFCKISNNLQPAKQSLFSLIPEAAVHINFTVNLERFFRTSI